jgi:hypothetical protein
MATQPISFFKRFWKQSIIALLAIAYIVVNVFRIGGDVFIFNLNAGVVPPLAIGTVILALGLWRHSIKGTLDRLLWMGLTIGWSLWALAESLWAIAALIGQEVPYPSWSDFFWLAGYIPMYIALWIRIRPLPNISHPWRRIGVWVISLASLSWTTFFIIIPIIQSNDPTAIFESVLNIAYPLADLVLLLLVLRIFFTYQRGMYGQVWVWLSIGFILFAVGDLVFAYTNAANLYYPDQQANLISTLGTDVPYNFSYLMWCIGLLLLQTLQSIHKPIKVGNAKELTLVPNTHVMIFTKGDDTVIDVSRNYGRVFLQDSVKRLSETLGISPEDENSLLDEIKASGVLHERPITVTTHSQQVQGFISGISVLDPDNKYSGATLLVRLNTPDYSLDKLMTEQDKGVLRVLMQRTGTGQKEQEEIKELLSNYFLTFIQAYYNHVVAEWGSNVADAFVSELQSAATQHGWQTGNSQPSPLLPEISHLTISETRKALSILFGTAKQFLTNLTDDMSVNSLTQEIRSKFSQPALENVSHFE